MAKKSFNDLACYIGLVVSSFLIVVTDLLPDLITMSAGTLSTLTTIKDIALIVGIGFGARAYSNGSLLKKVIFWAAAGIYVAVVFLGLF